jgi:predicted component of type VI protein secretion system
VTPGARGEVLLAGRPETAVEITDGLAAGAIVLRGTVGVLRDGTPVKLPAGPTPPASAAAGMVPASSAVR